MFVDNKEIDTLISITKRIGVMVAQETLNLLVFVRLKYSQPLDEALK